MTWLITGGAGYIGCHVVRALGAAGVDVVALDDLSNGVPARLPRDVPIEVGSTLDIAMLERVLSSYQITGVVHLAAKKRVDESLAEPSRYFKENVEGLRLLLDQCEHSSVRHFLFSSSGAVYGASDAVTVDESSPCLPANPYGQTKLAGEWLVHGVVGAASGMSTMALRYFSVAGAGGPGLGDANGDNLIPKVLRAIRHGQPPVIFGTDYPTPDGTCVRDFVHVVDVADAHVAAVRALERGTTAATCNIGTGRGASVRSVVSTALTVTGSDLEPVAAPRRAGDVPSVIAVADAARRQLKWSAKLTLGEMISSAWDSMAVKA